MRIAIIGYGKMGKAIEKIALEREHIISDIIDVNSNNMSDIVLSEDTDVAIEFTNPLSAKNNIYNCIENKIPIVSGTTGWDIDFNEIKRLCELKDTAVFQSSNFSIGMGIFMQINEKLANLLGKFGDYSARIEESHHIHKLDKPSGTAISLANGVIDNNSKYKSWELNSSTDIQNLGIVSFREGEIIGDHKIIWENDIDKITIEHSAKTRLGFALGAVLAAEFIQNKKGFFNMNNLLNL